jgi:hypothetical protein
MNIETILDAMEEAKYESNWWFSVINAPGYEKENKQKYERRARQYVTFRARILWMFKELEEEIEYLVEYGNR